VAEETDLPFVTAENKFEALVSDYMHTIVGVFFFVDTQLLIMVCRFHTISWMIRI
jgi:hypothetical protein